jgi:hypothetical protein
MNPLSYPRPVAIDSPKLKKLLEEKLEMVMNGREISQEVEEIDKEMDLIDKEIQKQELKADIKDLKKMATDITTRFNAIMKEMEDLKATMYKRAKEKVDPSLVQNYESKKKLKEEKETARRKIALKVQKWNDKIIPLSQALMRPELKDEYDDYYGLVLENNEVIGTIFNHKVDFEKRFREGRFNGNYKK